MRISYMNGKLFVSLTRDECAHAYDKIGMPIEVDVGNIKVLHEDINKIVTEYLKDLETRENVTQSK